MVPQDLLSFELLDINIVQELENVPNNTPAGEQHFSLLLKDIVFGQSQQKFCSYMKLHSGETCFNLDIELTAVF